MRPAGAVCLALLSACRQLATDERGATLQELAQAACVGRDAARSMVPALKRRGHLQIVRTRRVDYRNRPVAEYALASRSVPVGAVGLELGRCLAGWARA